MPVEIPRLGLIYFTDEKEAEPALHGLAPGETKPCLEIRCDVRLVIVNMNGATLLVRHEVLERYMFPGGEADLFTNQTERRTRLGITDLHAKLADAERELREETGYCIGEGSLRRLAKSPGLREATIFFRLGDQIHAETNFIVPEADIHLVPSHRRGDDPETGRRTWVSLIKLADGRSGIPILPSTAVAARHAMMSLGDHQPVNKWYFLPYWLTKPFEQ